MFIDREKEIDEIITRIINHTQSSAISGDCGLGKTALLKRLADPGQLRQLNLPADKYILVYFNCPAAVAHYTPELFWQDIFTLIKSRLTEKNLLELAENIIQSPLFDFYEIENFFYEARRVQNLSYILLLDDFDFLLANREFKHDFLWSLKNLANNNIDYNFGLVTSTLDRLSQLCHDVKLLHSPFFNIFSNINLAPFSKTLCYDFIQTHLSATKLAEKDAEILCEISGGIPLILNLVCEYYTTTARILDFMERAKPPAWNTRQQEIIFDYIQRLWYNSPPTEKEALLNLASQYLLNKQLKLQLPVLNSLKQEFISHWDGLVRRGIFFPSGSLFDLFPRIFLDFIFQKIQPDGVDLRFHLTTLKEIKAIREYIRQLPIFTGDGLHSINE